MTTTTTLAERLAAVRSKIDDACVRAGRNPSEVTLVGVSKTHPVEAVAEAVQAGLVDLGENWAQELVPKAEAVAAMGLRPRWHFIGHLQRNKVREVVPHIASLHSLDSLRLADELERRLTQTERGSLECFIEVNVAGEDSKTGVAPSEVPALLAHARTLPHLEVVGLMTVAPDAHDEVEQVRPVFRALRAMASDLGLPQLSMGMSGDYLIAIEEGATLVRIGTAIFGPRRV
jgi:pyridoxal phosphate enzyme (YggS family)